MFKKIIACFLVSLLVFTLLSGCETSKQGKDAPSAQVTTDIETKKEEIYTYSLATYSIAPADPDAEMVAYWEKQFNVKFDIVYLENSKYLDLLNLRIASNETPDVIMAGGLQRIKEYKEKGVIGGWSEEFLKKSAPKIARFIDEICGEDGWKLSKIDDKMYVIPSKRAYNMYNNAIVWRGDWLKNVGIDSVPKTLDDVEKAFYKFRNEDPDKNVKKDTYALSSEGLSSIYGAFGAMPDSWIKDANGNLVNGSVVQGAREALQLLSKWYKDDILDPEYITGENKGGYWAITHSFDNGRIGYTGIGSWYHWMNWSPGDPSNSYNQNTETLKTANPDATLAYGYPPVGPNGHRGRSKPSDWDFRSMYSANLVKNEAKFAKLLKVIEEMSGFDNMEVYITMRDGIKGKHWDYNDKNQPIPKEGFTMQTEQQKIGAFTTFLILELPDGEKALLPDLFEFADELFEDKDRTFSYENLLLTNTPSTAKYSTDLKKILDEGYTDIITGKKDISYFDEMVAKWNKAGGEQLTKEANDWYNTVK
jgi:putative aldouronate transport system substrate-binding protein